jgi:hypothetical protein
VIDRNDYYNFFQLALQGVAGKTTYAGKSLTPQTKADLASQIADACMSRMVRHANEMKCAADTANDPHSTDIIYLVLPHSANSQWGESFRNALQGTASADFKSPDEPVKEASKIADQAVLSSGQIEKSLWDIFMKCHRTIDR